jgi:uncharacterized protein (TIGR02996 family)
VSDREDAALERAFLQAIIDTPEDDAPRLVYADWLDENGQPERAELIRVQCRLAELCPSIGRPKPDFETTWREKLRLAARTVELLEQHRQRWAAPLEGLVTDPRFRRGFVEAVEVAGDHPFAEGLAKAVTLAPIRSLTVKAVTWKYVRQAVPAMARLRRLHFPEANFSSGSRLAQRFFGRPELRRLAFLSLCGAWMPEEVAVAVVTSPALAGLTELKMERGILGGLPCAVLRELARSPSMANLLRLRLAPETLDAETLHLLGHSPHLPNLKELDLCSHDGMASDCVEVLLAAPLFAGLERLCLGHDQVKGREDVLRGRFGSRLVAHLDWSPIWDDGC